MKSVSLFMLPYVTRQLPTEDYGRYEVLLTFINIGTIIGGLGLTDILFRYTGKAENEQELRRLSGETLGFSLVLSTAIFILGQAIAPAIANVVPGGANTFEIRLLIVMIALEGIISVPLAWLRLVDRAKSFFIFTTGRGVGQAILVFIALQSGLGLIGLLYACVISTIVQAVILMSYQLKETQAYWNTQYLIRSLNYGLPIVISGLIGFSTRGLDVWFLAEEAGDLSVAQYGVAFKFSSLIHFALQPYEMWWLPKRFRLLQQKNGIKRAADGAVFGVALTLLITVGVAFFAPILLKLILTEKYHQACMLVPWLSSYIGLKRSAELLNLGCYIENNTRNVLIINLISAVFAILGFVILIPQLKSIGAVISLILAGIIRLILFFVISQATLRLPYPSKSLALLWILTCICLLINLSEFLTSIAWPVALISWIGIGYITMRMLYESSSYSENEIAAESK
ncbi:MAG: hypothetical protein CL859_11290 [Cyanobium sp. ARS6]|nr:hypothetical protein [Cyanobium sp. ARS6]